MEAVCFHFVDAVKPAPTTFEQSLLTPNIIGATSPKGVNMKFPLSKVFAQYIGVFAVSAVAVFAHAQSFPNKPLNMIVAFPAGGGSDVIGRLVAKGMQDALGQTIIVENVVGVGGSLGVLKAANATPDGYTVLAGSPLELIYTPLGVAAAKNKPEDMKMAALVGHTPIAIAVRKDLPVNTLDEFVAHVKKADKPLSFGSTGVGSLYHLMAEKAMQNAGAKGLHAPYNGLAPYLKDLMGGTIDFAVVPLVGPVLGAAEKGQIKLLAVAANQPLSTLPKLPTAKTTKGFEEYVFSIWIGVQVGAKTPEAQTKAIHDAVYKALGNPDTRKTIETAGSVIAEPMTLAQLDAFYKKEIAAGAAMAKSINLQAQ
jgi:tripartite-type tricarboxylate transporter receptor subunit TctC